MNTDEKALARVMFKKKIHESKGQAFEDLFCQIMAYAEPDFQPIKAWGNIGDRKNDGYIKTKGIYFQVYAPEDIEKSYAHLKDKLRTDFEGLKNQWNNSTPIKEFYFVVNDCYKGVNADCENEITEIKNNHNLDNAGFKTAKDLENLLFKLEDDQIINIVDFFPDPAKIKTLDYSILKEVIDHIMQLPLNQTNASILKLPEWEEKIKFNGLSESISYRLKNGSFLLADLEAYLKNNGDFLSDELRDRINGIYKQEKQNFDGDQLFLEILKCASPRQMHMYYSSVIVIMAKYFECCDIFEEPQKAGQ